MKHMVLIIVGLLAICSHSIAAEFHIAPGGSDSNPGTVAKPFATLERARDAIRQLKEDNGFPANGVTVYLHGGKYFRTKPFALSCEDSGTIATPIVYKAYPDQVPRMIGGAQLNAAWFTPITKDSPVWSRLDDAAQGKVLQCDLAKHGIKDYGTIRTYLKISPMELSVDGELMQIARWPNRLYAKIASVPDGKDSKRFGYSGKRPDRWTKATHLWVQGYLYWSWSYRTVSVANIDTENKIISLGKKPGYGITAWRKRSGGLWRIVNLLEELDTPGEYYVDSDTGNLYIWPKEDVKLAEILVSIIGDNEKSIVDIESASNITFEGVTFEMARYRAIEITDCENVLVNSCTIRNIGGDGVVVHGGKGVGVRNCELYGIGNEGIKLTGGDRRTLEPAGHYALNNEIHDFGRWGRTSRVAVRVAGVGNRVEHCLMYDAPHTAVMYAGNEHIFRFNEFHNILYETRDAGAIYAGRDWGARGNLIAYNFFHDMRAVEKDRDADFHAIYLDDCISGHTVFGNVVYGKDCTFNIGIMTGGGRDNTIENNVITHCKGAVWADSRGIRHIGNPKSGPSWDLLKNVKRFDYQNPPWSIAYPLLAVIPNDYTAPNFDSYKYPQGSKLLRNMGWKNEAWTKTGDPGSFDYFNVADNIEDADPLFVDEKNLYLALHEDSPAHSIPGFKRIPFEMMGRLLEDKATRPNPPSRQTNVGTTPTLYWAPALNAKSHDVYFGTDASTVEHQGNFSENRFKPGTLSNKLMYYWRIDEREANGRLLRKGDVWSFVCGPSH